MDNASILRIMSERRAKGPSRAEPEERLVKYVLFTIGERNYALGADKVREISFENELHYLPFLPSYVRGYANRHGLPYTVLDLSLLFEKRSLDSRTLLFLNVDDDQLALLVSGVDEIVKLPSASVHPLASEEESARYFANAITVKEREIFVLDLSTILRRLERDVERS